MKHSQHIQIGQIRRRVVFDVEGWQTPPQMLGLSTSVSVCPASLTRKLARHYKRNIRIGALDVDNFAE
jgi:hypothetical protein